MNSRNKEVPDLDMIEFAQEEVKWAKIRFKQCVQVLNTVLKADTIEYAEVLDNVERILDGMKDEMSNIRHFAPIAYTEES